MKSYTDIEQSKMLAEILPIESADMFYVYDRHLDKFYVDTPYVIGYKVLNKNVDIPCWSLAALLDMLDSQAGLGKDYDLWICYDNSKSHITKHHKHAIDAVFDMICWLKENGKL